MGWSCATVAAWRADSIAQACIAQTGSQNVFEVSGQRYMIEYSRREYTDGRITGALYRYLDDDRVKRTGSICITPEGKIKGGLAYLRALPFALLYVDGRPQGPWNFTRWPAVTRETLAACMSDWVEAYTRNNPHLGSPTVTQAEVRDQDDRQLAQWTAPTFLVHRVIARQP